VGVDLPLLERISEERRFEARTLEIAKRLFIHGETPKRLSVEYGINIQRVYAIRKEVLAAAEQLDLPAGWTEVKLIGPSELIERLTQLHTEAMAMLGSSSKGASIQRRLLPRRAK
jgi:hypothetical protein